MKSQRKFILNGILFLLIGVISFVNSYFLNFFLEISDGATYSRAYKIISSLGPIDGYRNFMVFTGGAEPLSFLLFYLFSKFTSIEIFNGILNTFLLFGVFKFLYDHRIKILIAFPIVITNYYLLILEFGVLRLKIAIIFWILSLNTKNKNKSNLFSFLSFLSHFQMALIFFIKLLVNLVVKRNFKIKVNYIIIFLVVSAFLFERILEKFLLYSLYADWRLRVPFKTILFFIPMLFVVNRIKFLSITFIIFFVVGLLIGEDRILILLFFLLMSEYLLFVKRYIYRSFILIIYCTYFSYTGIYFAKTLIDGVSYFQN